MCDRYYKMIFKCDPFVPNFKNKPMYCLVDLHPEPRPHEPGSPNTTESGETEELKLHVSTNYKVEKREPTKHRMISHVDDIRAVLREASEKDENERPSS